MTTVNQLRDFVAKENKLGEADMAKAVRARLEGKTGAKAEEGAIKAAIASNMAVRKAAEQHPEPGIQIVSEQHIRNVVTDGVESEIQRKVDTARANEITTRRVSRRNVSHPDTELIFREAQAASGLLERNECARCMSLCNAGNPIWMPPSQVGDCAYVKGQSAGVNNSSAASNPSLLEAFENN